MYCVGLTGPIASGKSTVAGLFAEQGVDLISADAIAKELTSKGQPALTKIIQHFGKGFLDNAGHLQRGKLREHIFQDPLARKWLENLLHPLIRQAIATKILQAPKLYYMIEIPLLKNRQKYPYLNRILLISTVRNLQMQRLIQRDQHNEEQVKTIFAAQVEHHIDKAAVDDIIINTGSLADLKQEVLQLHQQYCINSTNF